MSDFIEIKVDDKPLNNLLNKLAAKTQDMRPIMRNISEIMKDSIKQNFEQQGRPQKWHPWSEPYRKWREKHGFIPDKILTLRGELAASITAKYDNNSAVVGTNKEYAAIHQLGYKGSVNVKNHTRQGISGLINVRGHARNINIPARPFLVLTDGDIQEITQETEKYFTE